MPFALRVAFGAEVEGHHDRAAEAARAAEEHHPRSFEAQGLAERLQWKRANRLRPPGRLAELTEKEADVLGTLVMCGDTALSYREMEPELAQMAAFGNWRDFSPHGTRPVLRRLEARGLVRREPQVRAELRDPLYRWRVTEAGLEANGRWLDAYDDWLDTTRV